VHYDKGKYISGIFLDTAIIYFQKVIDFQPDNSEAYLNMGYVYLAMCNYNTDYYPKAVEYFEIAAKLGNEEAQQWLSDNGYGRNK